VHEELLAACPRLKVVAGALKGADNIDVTACTRRGVWVTVVPDLLTAPTAELAVALLLGLARNVAPGDARVRGADFDGWRPTLYGRTLDGATAGIVGLGAVGRAIAERLAGFGCRVLGHDPHPGDAGRAMVPENVPLDALLAASDHVILAAPLTAESHHLLDGARLRTMREGALLVNVGRGSVVDEEAVADALTAGRLGGYAADVFELEDRSLPDRPRTVAPRLLAMRDRTLFTPHLGSAVASVRLAIEHTAARSVRAVLEGKRPPGAVNEVG
jgi:phosphonate dehydrogenase